MFGDAGYQGADKRPDAKACRVAEARARAESAQAQAVMDASSACEVAAGLRGQLEATQAHAAELLRVVSVANGADAGREKLPASPPKKTK